MDIEKFNSSPFKGQMKETVSLCDELRRHKDHPMEISFEEMVKDKFKIEPENFWHEMGIDPSYDTIHNIFTTAEVNEDLRFVIPEIILSAIRLGLRKTPIWPNITAAEVQLSQLTAVVPSINMSEATPKRVNETETIKTGQVSFQQKKIELFKIGRGLKISYEVLQYVSLDILGIFLEDFGVQLGLGLDTLAIDTCINGEQEDGSESAPVIGVQTPAALDYVDFLHPWIRGSRMGTNYNTIIGGEDEAIITLNLPEFKDRAEGTPLKTINLQTPLPSSSAYYIHGNIPVDQQLFIDPARAITKYNAQPLLIESDRIISNQQLETYATLTTGFAKLFRSGALLMDKSLDFDSGAGFPEYMNVDPLENVIFDDE